MTGDGDDPSIVSIDKKVETSGTDGVVRGSWTRPGGSSASRRHTAAVAHGRPAGVGHAGRAGRKVLPTPSVLPEQSGGDWPGDTHMTQIEISDDLKARIDSHREEGESVEEFIDELVTIYETEGSFLQEGYTE